MLTADKVTELFCMADDFCKFFDKMTAKYTLKSGNKRPYHRDSTLSKAEIMLIMILFHDSGYRCLKHFYLEFVELTLIQILPTTYYNKRLWGVFFVRCQEFCALPHSELLATLDIDAAG